MEKINNTPNEAPPVIYKLDDIPRCPDCNLICSLKLNYEDGNPMIEYECENKHKGNISLKEYLNKCNKFSLSKEKCKDCGKNQKEVKGDFYYCSKCNKFICFSCQLNHPFGERHNIINFKNLDIIKDNIINAINKLKESSELEMKFIKILLYTYQYEEKQNNINYNILQNLQNIKSNSFKNNFKTLKNHTNLVNYLSKLNDGRLISCGDDHLLNIYKKDSYELQLSIKEHSNCIRSLTQLNNGRIISCSDDKTMKIIKLIGEDNYQIEQTLQGHRSYVCKVIEIKDNELISVSYDKTMKIWKIKNENKFECDKTITFQNSESDCNILRLNENEFVTSSCSDKCIKFWNSNNYSNFKSINNIELDWTIKTMCLLEDDILCVGGYNSKGFYLIKISTHQLIKNILGPK